MQPCAFKWESIICIDEQCSAPATFNDFSFFLSFLCVTHTSYIILPVSENLIHNCCSNLLLKGTGFDAFIGI